MVLHFWANFRLGWMGVSTRSGLVIGSNGRAAKAEDRVECRDSCGFSVKHHKFYFTKPIFFKSILTCERRPSNLPHEIDVTVGLGRVQLSRKSKVKKLKIRTLAEEIPINCPQNSSPVMLSQDTAQKIHAHFQKIVRWYRILLASTMEAASLPCLMQQQWIHHAEAQKGTDCLRGKTRFGRENCIWRSDGEEGFHMK